MINFEERLNRITDLGELDGFANKRRYFPMLEKWTPEELDLILRHKFYLQKAEWQLGPKTIKAAQAMSAKMGTLKNSMTDGGGNVPAFVGEIIVQKITGAKHQNTFDYDLITNAGTRIDVKTTMTSVEPKYDYDCKVSAYYKQNCDWYAFVRVNYKLDRAWVVGYYPRNDFYKDARHYQAGDPFFAGIDKLYEKECFVMPLWKLKGKIDEAV
tara:strand:+ start:345 stop:980 length:636 start_codon:yes stop_codon:yes gene_type:complete